MQWKSSIALQRLIDIRQSYSEEVYGSSVDKGSADEGSADEGSADEGSDEGGADESAFNIFDEGGPSEAGGSGDPVQDIVIELSPENIAAILAADAATASVPNHPSSPTTDQLANAIQDINIGTDENKRNRKMKVRLNKEGEIEEVRFNEDDEWVKVEQSQNEHILTSVNEKWNEFVRVQTELIISSLRIVNKDESVENYEIKEINYRIRDYGVLLRDGGFIGKGDNPKKLDINSPGTYILKNSQSSLIITVENQAVEPNNRLFAKFQYIVLRKRPSRAPELPLSQSGGNPRRLRF
jgi:hypothetical protein